MKRNPIISLLSYTWKYAFTTKHYIVWVFILSIISNVIYLLEPLVIGRIFNAIQFYQNNDNLLGDISKLFSLLVVITFTSWIFHGASRTLERRNSFLVRKNYKQKMLDIVLDLPASWHKDHHSGDTIDKVNKASDSLYNFADALFLIIENFTKLIGSIVILTFFDWKASLIAGVFTIIAVGVLLGFDKKIVKDLKKIFKAQNFLAAAVHDYISNVMTIITLRLKERVSREVEVRSMKPYPIYRKNIAMIELKWFTANMIVTVMIVAALILGAYNSYRINGVIVIGTLFTLYKYLQSVGDTFYSFAWFYGGLVQQNAALEAAEIINQAHDKLTAKENVYLPNDWKTIQIKDLTFHYDAQTKNSILENHIDAISLTIEKGKRIALIGESGSGKSTVLALLRGLYEADAVRLYCNEKKLSYGLAHLWEQVTLIPQEPEIFNSTIEDNITMGVAVSKQKLENAIELARFNQVVERLPKGLKTNIMEKGVNLSGGEKQRLALARGILAARDSEFLFLDEPTSSVDSTNEKHIYQNIFEKFKDKTILSSIHRLHLLRQFDYIYYFKHGKLLTEGTFLTLLEDKDFKVLWDNYLAEDNRKNVK